jgi:CheY-like chemotaxis protein
VKDPGPGIEPARQKELFQPFSQIAPVMTRAKGGTGLGLAIVKRILDALGGSVGLDSAPGAGSTFHARFTAAPAKLADAAPVAPPSRAARLRPLRILLAEDNAVNRQVAGRMLQHLGQAPATAVDGSEAVAKVEAGAFDLVLMDIHMPGMDGLEATRRIRQAGSKVRIVALTADALVEDRAKCLAAGMDDYISKPVRLDELERVLRTAAAA